MTTVLIVDDEALVRSGLSLILGADEGLQVVGAVTGVGAVAAVLDLRPDLVLLDIRMPQVDGLQVLRQLSEFSAPPIVAMLTTFGSDELLTAALLGGAAGFLLKDTDPFALIRIVHALAGGGTVLAPGVDRSRLAAASIDLVARARVDALTQREREVLRMIAEGATNTEIAQKLMVSLGTVKLDVSAVLDALGVRRRVLAALTAVRAGLVAP